VNFLDSIGQAVRVDIDGQSRGQDSGCVRSMSITLCFVRDHGRNAGIEIEPRSIAIRYQSLSFHRQFAGWVSRGRPQTV